MEKYEIITKLKYKNLNKLSNPYRYVSYYYYYYYSYYSYYYYYYYSVTNLSPVVIFVLGP